MQQQNPSLVYFILYGSRQSFFKGSSVASIFQQRSYLPLSFLFLTLYFNYSFLCISSYKHALDGIIRISREEGVLKLFNGVQWASTRAVAVTIGQLCFYDLVKAQLLKTAYFEDNLTTHFTSSLCAVSFFTK